MKSRTLFAAALILLAPLVVLAFQAQAEQVHKNQLRSKSFTAGSLKITLTGSSGIGGINAPSLLSSTPTLLGIEVENTSGDITTFAPQMLTFIDKDDNQVDIVGQYSGESLQGVWRPSAVGDKRVWPKARIKHTYVLADMVRLPARLYYEDKLLARIIE